MMYGKKNAELVSITIIDHPKNPGYPTYWHARGYGLFAANSLGQEPLSGGKEKLNLEFKINNLVDMAPETSDSLRPGAKNFDATKWVSELHSLKMQIKLKGIELSEAEAIVKEWFTDSAE